jgi:glutathione synthase/RimK-type ligase-like ATP-grasp enzyme
VVVFDNIYPIKIHSQDSNLTKNDWRVHDDAHVKWEMTKLPEKVCNQLLQLGKQLQLNWYSVDLIFSTDNEYVFLEINRPGAHYWLDTFVGFDVSKVIVELVKEKKIIDEYES